MRQDISTIDAVFAVAAREAGDAPHLFLDGEMVTYAQTYERARCLAGALSARGVGRGDRVISFAGNCRALYEYFIATSMLGAIAVPINTMSTPFEIARIVQDCDATACVAEGDRGLVMTDEGLQRMAARLTVGVPVEGWEEYESVLADADPVTTIASRPSDPCLIIYSSGTTGNPKGIVLRQKCLLENATRVIERLHYSSTDVFLTLLPSFHLFGYCFDFMYSGLCHAPMVVMKEFDADEALSLIERYEVTVLTGVPTMFARMFDQRRLAGRDVSSLRLLDVGGGPVSPTLKRHLREIGIDAVESYGMTELSCVSTVQIPGVDAPEGSCGPVLRDFEVKVVDSEGRDQLVGEPGELLFRSPTLMHSYWNQPELTAETLRDGWLHTGDVGRIDDEGNVYILDRIKDMIVTNGFNVFPKELENAIALHPGVLTVAVVGVPDALKGEIIHAFVVPRPGASLSNEEVASHCEHHLARYKRPRYINILDELPMTVTGKIRRFVLRDMAIAEQAANRTVRPELNKAALANRSSQ